MTVDLFQQRRLGGATAVSTDAPSINDQSVAFGQTAAVFKSWDSAAMSLAVWRREPPADVGRLLDELRLDAITGWRKTLDAATAAPVIAQLMATSGFSEPVLERFLATDIILLARIFATTTGTRAIEARLDVIRDDACRRFHVDNYPARLAVTYVGPGTVWVPSCYGKKALIEQDGYSGPAFVFPAYSAGLFAGEAAGRTGLVHRSPCIAGTGRTRLFFCVNAAGH